MKVHNCSMKRIGIGFSDETALRLRKYVFEKYGSLHGLSEVVETAVKEYLDRQEDNR